jgi:hypothetical protein
MRHVRGSGGAAYALIHQVYSKRRFMMWLGLAVIVFLLWLIGAFVFKVVGGLIHLLVVLAIAAIVVHFVKKKTTV